VSTNSSGGQQAPVVQKVRPLQPKRFNRIQDMETMVRFLDEVEHLVWQGGAICSRASKDNQNIDMAWHFLTTQAFHWFGDTMTKQNFSSIFPENYEYRITWEGVRDAFKNRTFRSRRYQ